jgi:hypothetical protein
MATAASNSNPSKKRNTLLSHFLSSKNLSIFRNKPSTTAHTNKSTKDSQHYKSHININTQQQTPIPMCIGRGWLKNRLKRPVSLDMDLVKTFVHQPSINSDGKLVEEQQQLPINDIGTIMGRLSILYIYLFLRNSKEQKIDKAEILVAKQIVDMPIKQTGKYSKQYIPLGMSIVRNHIFGVFLL